MDLITHDKNKTIVIDTDTWHSVYSTILYWLKVYSEEIPLALELFANKSSYGLNQIEVARQVNLVRDELSRFRPDEAIFDISDLSKRAPWYDNVSPTVTSCGNLYMTSDGKDLFSELVELLTYCHFYKSYIEIS